jgi:enterochelin esterase family protein
MSDMIDATERAVARFRADRRSPVFATDGDAVLVTLVRERHEGEGETLVVGGFVQGGYTPRVLDPYGELDARTWRLPADYLGTYLYWVGAPGLIYPDDFDALLPVLYGPDGGPRPDARNDDRFEYPVDPEHPSPPFVQSVLRGPAAPDEPFLGAPMLGRLTEHRLRSERLGDERRVWVHESVGVDDATAAEPPVLMVVFDGGIYAHLMHTPEQVDALVARGELPPTVTLYCHYADDASRHAELACRADFADFVTTELVPWAAGQWRFTDDPARSIVAGSSLGGLGSGWLAYRHPDRFANVLAQSVPWGWRPDGDPPPAGAEPIGWLTERWLADGPRHTIVYTEMGTFETGTDAHGVSAFDHSLRFVEQLRSVGVDVDFGTYSGGHDYLCWRATFARGLRSIVARW